MSEVIEESGKGCFRLRYTIITTQGCPKRFQPVGNEGAAGVPRQGFTPELLRPGKWAGLKAETLAYPGLVQIFQRWYSVSFSNTMNDVYSVTIE